MSQGNSNNPTAAASAELAPPLGAKQAVNKAPAKRLVLILTVVALSLYVGSIAWFYATRGAA